MMQLLTKSRVPIALLSALFLLVTLLACDSAHAADGEAKVAYVDTPLGQPVDGKTWLIEVDEELGLATGVAWADSNMRVSLVYQSKGFIKKLPSEVNYAIKMTIGERTRYQWRGNEKVEPSERDMSSRFNRLIFQGLEIGKSHPYRVEIRTGDGKRFVKNGKITFGSKFGNFAIEDLESARKAVAFSTANLNKSEPGSMRFFNAKKKLLEYQAEAEAALVLNANADPAQAWSKMNKHYAEWENLITGPKPPDNRASDELWVKHVAQYKEKLILAQLEMHIDIPLPDSAKKATRLLNEIDPERMRSSERVMRLQQIAGLHYSFTGKASAARPQLLEAYDLVVKNEKERAINTKRAYEHRPLAEHVLPTDFEPVIVNRNAVQAQLCAAKQRALLARRVIASSENRAERTEAVKALSQAQEDQERLSALLASIPGPANNPRLVTHQRVRNTTIARSFDLTDPDAVKARELALARYDDLIYVEPDNSVHGNFKAALRIAMPEVAPKRPAPLISFGEFVTVSGDNLEQIGKALQLAEGVDKTQGGYQVLQKLADASRTLEQLIEATGTLSNTSPEHMHKVKVLMSRAAALADDGVLSAKSLTLALMEVNRLPAKEIENLKDAVDALKNLKKIREGTSLAAVSERLKRGFHLASTVSEADWKRLKDIVTATAKEAGSFEMNAMDKFVLLASAGQAVGSFIEQVDAGVDYREAGGRAFAQFGVDIAFTYFPLLGLVDMVSEVISVPIVRYTTGEFGKYNLSDMTKDVLQVTLDVWAERMQDAGTLYEYAFYGVSTIGSLKNVAPDTIRMYLDRVECQLATFETDIYDSPTFATSEPGMTAARLIRQRAVFRVLLRAHAEAGGDPWKVAHVNNHLYTISYPPGWTLTDRSDQNPLIHRQRVTPPGFVALDSEIVMEIEVIPAESLKVLNRKAALPPAEAWWNSVIGDTKLKQMKWIQEPASSKRRGRTINLIELTCESPVTKDITWVKAYQIIHAGQVVEVRIGCPEKRLGEYKELLDKIESKFLMHPAKKPRR